MAALRADGEGPHGSWLDRRLAAALLGERFTLGRLSSQNAWQRCVAADSAQGPGAPCGEPLRPGTRRYSRVSEASRGLARHLPPDSAPATLRARAILDLRWSDAVPSRLDEAVELLERARRSAPEDPAILNDLAVAYLEQARRDQRLEPMLRALDAVGRALARDSLHRAALFNRALILERLYLMESAEQAWSRYLAVEHRSGWKAEAREHTRRLADRPAPPPLRELVGLLARGAAPWAALLSRVRSSPQEARDTSLALLGEWGAAVRREDRARAVRLLATVRELAAAIDAVRGDGSVRLALETIDAVARDADRLQALAQAHAELAGGIEHFAGAGYDSAAASLARAEDALRSLGSPAARWAAFYRSGALINLGEYGAADSTLRRIAAEATPGEPALIGKAVWARGVAQVRRGYYDEASRFYRAARPYILRAKEPENEGAISYLLSESLSLAGQTGAGQAEAYRGLRMLSPFRRSIYLNNQLSTVAALARAEGLGHAALALMGEVLEVGSSTGKDDVMAWLLRARARDRAALGDTAGARADLSAALRRAQRIQDEKGRGRVRADVRLVQGQLLRARDPRSALRVLSEVVATYRRLDLGVYLPRALYEAAMAAQASGDLDGAHLRLEEAIRRIESQQDSFRIAESRATHLETVESIFDAMVGVELERRRPAAAFEYLERGRLAAWPRNERSRAPRAPGEAPPAPAEVAARLPEGMLLVEYALLPEQVVIWTVSRRGERQYTLSTTRDSVAALVERFVRERGRALVAPDDARARLFELLLRPLTGELDGVRELTIVPDRELHQLAFAALWDAERRSYVVERYRLRTVPSAAFFLAVQRQARRPAAGPAALVVGSPALDPALSLPPLPGAALEAEQVARLYRPAMLLAGAEARRGRVTELLPNYSVFHFAGHAVFNPEQPELSFLALAPDGPGEPGVLHAWEIAGGRPSNVSVAVLSACSTLNPRPSRAGPTTGLAYSFLRTGVPATVSTLWDVVDDETTELLVEFHRRLAGGTPAPEALRLAQVSALGSDDPGVRAPQTWAAFIYTGP